MMGSAVAAEGVLRQLSGDTDQLYQICQSLEDALANAPEIGGLSCAVAVKEQLPDADVLIIEKQTAGYSGKANRGGGWFSDEKEENALES